MENINIIDNKSFEETKIIPEKEEVVVCTLDEVIAQRENILEGIASNKNMLKILGEELEAVDEKIAYLREQGLKTEGEIKEEEVLEEVEE